jgi:hypothetical protein
MFLRSAQVQHLASICWSFATLGHEAEALFKSVAGVPDRIVKDANVQEVANILWAYAIKGYWDAGRGLYETMWKRVCDGQLKFNREHYKQVSEPRGLN